MTVFFVVVVNEQNGAVSVFGSWLPQRSIALRPLRHIHFLIAFLTPLSLFSNSSPLHPLFHLLLPSYSRTKNSNSHSSVESTSASYVDEPIFGAKPLRNAFRYECRPRHLGVHAAKNVTFFPLSRQRASLVDAYFSVSRILHPYMW